MLRIGPEESLTGQIFLSELGVQQKKYTNCIALVKFDALCPTLFWINTFQSSLFGSVSTGPGPFTMSNTSSGSSCVNPNPVGLPIHRDPRWFKRAQSSEKRKEFECKGFQVASYMSIR